MKDELVHKLATERHLHTVPGCDVPMQDVGRVEEGQAVRGLHCQLHQLGCTQVSAAVLLQVPGEEEAKWTLIVQTQDAGLFSFRSITIHSIYVIIISLSKLQKKHADEIVLYTCMKILKKCDLLQSCQTDATDS